MNKLVAAGLIAALGTSSMGCGTVLNGSTTTIMAPPGSSIDGMMVQGPVVVSQHHPHEVVFPDGRRCFIDSRISIGYLVADVVLLFLVGVIIDAVTGDWKVLDAGMCPGVIVN